MNEQAEATGTLSGVITDLRRIILGMPVSEAKCSTTAGTLDRLATELTEAAELLRKA